jgi:CheY-like chemotaxis protein
LRLRGSKVLSRPAPLAGFVRTVCILREKALTNDPGAQRTELEKRIVLVVDGDCMRQFFTSVFLQRLNYHTFPVKTAEEALMIMDVTEPLLVMTEITLPQMSGLELLKSMKRNPRTERIPVLISTTLKDPAHQEACEKAGCAGYITQPADNNRLYEAIQRATETTPRRFVRLATSLDVIVEGAAQREGGAKEQVTAISEYGMYVSTPAPLARGTIVPFTLFLDRSLAWGIRVEGKVLYSNLSASPGKAPGMGVKFTQIRPEDRESIRIFIGQKLMQGIATPVKTSGWQR